MHKESQENLEKFKLYLMENERARNTIDAYTTSIKEFFKEYDTLCKENMLAFKAKQLEKWKPGTVSLRIVALNCFCDFLGHPEWRVKKVRIHKAVCVENVITAEEYHKLLDGLKEDGKEKQYWMLKYLAKTGARVSEFIRLDKSGLSKGYCEMQTKGKIRRIYIPKSLIEESKGYFDSQEGDLLFQSRYGERYTPEGIRQWLRTIGKRYGVRKEVMHPHSFRHLYATEFLKKNGNVTLLADLMGHSSVSTTAIYLKLSQEEQMKQFNAASDW